MATYKHFLVDKPVPYVAHVQINRPKKLNAFFEEMWLELKTVFDNLSIDSDVRSIVLSGAGERAFTAGLDVEFASQQGTFQQADQKSSDVARKAVAIKRDVEIFQNCISSIEKCEKPVICVLHGVCFGLALDISTCADIRIASADARMSVKEVDIGIAADIGILTRMPKVVGSFSWVKETALSARIFGAEEALRVGFVSQVKENKAKALEAAMEIAALLATKSPVAVQGTKELLNHARDNTVASSLRYTGVWNSAATQTSDTKTALLSGLKKTRPIFEKL